MPVDYKRALREQAEELATKEQAVAEPIATAGRQD
jgi:hypothetical protein